MKRKLLTYIVCLGIVYLVAAIGSMFTSQATQSVWYERTKPAITPPNYVFPIVWTILFLCIALAMAITWLSTKEKREVIFAYGSNLVLNMVWSLLYFGLKNPAAAFIEILFLEATIFWMIAVSWKKKTAVYLLVPYALWVGFAAVLNWMAI